MTDLVPATTPHSPVGTVENAAATLAGELVEHVLAELPALATLDDRDRLLSAAWLASLRSGRTRRAYAGDLLAWRAWLVECCAALKMPMSAAFVSADGVGRENPAGRGRGGVSSVWCRLWSAWCRWCQSMTSVTAERAALSSTRFLPPANAATRDCSAMLLTARG